MMISLEDIQMLKHMLGATGNRRSWGYRNYYDPSDSDMENMRRLEAAGLVKEGRGWGRPVFFATEEGMKLIGFGKADIRRATER